MDRPYRMVGESIGGGLRTYRIAGPDGREFIRTCSSAQTPFHVGGHYLRTEIDELCPERIDAGWVRTSLRNPATSPTRPSKLNLTCYGEG
jgi:hypothetical protein